MEIKCQLDATEVFIADLIACSTCFGHHYALHQELKSIIQWLLPVVFRAVVFKLLVWCGAEGYVSSLQDAAGMQLHLLSRIKLSSVVCTTLGRGEVTEHKMCVLVFLLSETFLILIIQRDIIINVLKSSCKVPFIKFHENCLLEAELFHAGGGTDSRQTDVTKLTVAVRSVAISPRNFIIIIQ